MSASGGDAVATLGEVERLRTQVRSDRRATSVPLFALGALAAASAWITPFVGGIVLSFASLASALLVTGAVALYRERRRG